MFKVEDFFTTNPQVLLGVGLAFVLAICVYAALFLVGGDRREARRRAIQAARLERRRSEHLRRVSTSR